ncbi:hypothetical protein OIE68_14540 [Nocardia vinacea]|uniref:Uncharacterized protein n=1 Tax=Nocardia vinacea TaxID=96468 RepID=A0ABZ1YXL4_9NOCA|nr:hypothetical protein OIE68_14540 [Nocardia vinacea]
MTRPISITARAVLFGQVEREVVEGELAERLGASGVEQLALRRTPVATEVLRSAALREVARAVDGLLEVDLGGVAVAGWRRYQRLHSAAMRTRAGGVEQVELFEHEVTRSYCPRLEVTVDGSQVGEFELELCVTVLVRPLVATVRDGMLAALGPGDCTVSVSIGAPEVGPIIEREHPIPLATMVDLRRPIPLVDHQSPRPATASTRAVPRS